MNLGIRKRVFNEEDHAKSESVVPMEEHEQIGLVEELRKQASEDYKFQRKCMKILCLLFSAISLYLSEYHGVHVSLAVRLFSATLHIFSGHVLMNCKGVDDSGKDDSQSIVYLCLIMLSTECLYLFYIYEHYSKEEWYIPFLLVIGNTCTLSISLNFKRDMTTVLSSIDELDSLRYSHKSA